MIRVLSYYKRFLNYKTSNVLDVDETKIKMNDKILQ